jgi:hypothetical protein
MKMSQISTKLGFYLLIFSIILAFVWEPGESFFWCTILYLMIILNRRTNVKEMINEIALFDPKTPDLLDEIIMKCFDEYLALNEGFKNEKEYIRAEDEKKIIAILIEKVLTRMSKLTLAKLRAYYNEELLEDVLVERIYMLVTNYSIQNNRQEYSKDMELESRKKKRDPNTNIL